MGTGGMLIIIVRPESQKANVRVIRVRVTFQASRPGAVTSWGETIGPVPFRWRRPRWWRGPPMMRAPWAGRRWWLKAPGRSTGPPMMRRWPPLWRRGGTPSKPLSHAGPGGPTRGSRATPVPAVRWRRMGWVTTGRQTMPVLWEAVKQSIRLTLGCCARGMWNRQYWPR